MTCKKGLVLFLSKAYVLWRYNSDCGAGVLHNKAVLSFSPVVNQEYVIVILQPISRFIGMN